MAAQIRRRALLGALGGAAAHSVYWALAAHAQQPLRRVGMMIGSAENDPVTQTRVAAFRLALEKLGWIEGRNIVFEARFTGADPDYNQPVAKELVALKPDVILAHTTPIAAALRHESSVVPIVFVTVSDPVGSGLVASLARPGGSATGFLQYEEGIVGKWLAMLKEIAPGLQRAALIGNPRNTVYDYFLLAAETVAPRLAIEIVRSPVENTAADIQRAVETFARLPNGGLVLLPDNTNVLYRDLIIALAERHRLPAVYHLGLFVMAGGLMSYGIDQVDQFRQAATYVDRILRGEKPADLPVQAPTKYETVLNLKTAKALGLTVPDLLLVRADEVIE